jgi:lysophospholipase L1-like esterase
MWCVFPWVASVVMQAGAPLPVVQPRDGLPNVFARLRQGRPTTIVYFGGSITAGGGASKPEETSYRGLVGRWFAGTFPNVKVTNVNAAIGGTGSDLGAFRAARDVLAHKPDLVFVEYAVNDGGAPEAQILRSMEGIVRQIRRADPTTDICFVYTFVVGWLEDFRAGRPPASVRADEIVARRYGIPSVNVAVPAAARLIDGTMKADEFAKDGVHPTDAGYRIYADAIIGFLDAQRAASAKGMRHRLGPPLRPDCLEGARMLGPEEMGAIGPGWRVETSDPTGSFPKLLVADTPGAEQSIRFAGPILAMFYVLGPDTGRFDFRVDGGDWQTVDPFDQWAKEWPRAHYRLLADGLADGPHVVTFRIRADRNPQSKGTVTRIGYLCVNPRAR